MQLAVILSSLNLISYFVFFSSHLVLSNLLSIILDGFPNKLYFHQLILPTLANVLDEFTANKENNSMCLWLLICTSKSNIVHSFFTSILSENKSFLGSETKTCPPFFLCIVVGLVWYTNSGFTHPYSYVVFLHYLSRINGTVSKFQFFQILLDLVFYSILEVSFIDQNFVSYHLFR